VYWLVGAHPYSPSLEKLREQEADPQALTWINIAILWLAMALSGQGWSFERRRPGNVQGDFALLLNRGG
jgi:hypothetical protein